MKNSSRQFVDVLESRRLLSGTVLGGHFTPTPPDATIQADLTAVKAAETALDIKHGGLLLFETRESRFAGKENVHA